MHSLQPDDYERYPEGKKAFHEPIADDVTIPTWVLIQQFVIQLKTDKNCQLTIYHSQQQMKFCDKGKTEKKTHAAWPAFLN